MKTAILSSAIPQLPTGDIEKTADFFEKKLGFQIVAKMVDYNFLSVKRGPAEIHFWKASSEKEAQEIGRQSSCYIRVENIEILFAEFKERGAAFRYELIQQPWGMNEMQIDDPFLNAIRFGESID